MSPRLGLYLSHVKKPTRTFNPLGAEDRGSRFEILGRLLVISVKVVSNRSHRGSLGF